MAQRMPLPLTVSCFSKIQTEFTFLVPAHPGSPGQRAVKRVCVCVCVCGHARHSHEVDWLQFANWSSVQFSSSAAVNAPLHTDHEARGDLQQNAERENTQNNRQRRDPGDLSRRRLATMARISTARSRISCCMAILIAMKHPVRPIPALNNTVHNHQQIIHSTDSTAIILHC